MFVDFKRTLFIKLRQKLPAHLRSIDNFYFISFAASTVICILPLSLLLASIGQARPAWSTAVCALLATLCILLWRYGLPLLWAQSLYQASLMWVILYNAYYSGGVMSPVMVWMGIVPILPLFTVSRRWSYGWLAVSFVAVLIMYVTQQHGLIPIVRDASAEKMILSTIMVGLLCITQIMLVITYDTASAQSIRHITRKNQTLNTLSHELRLANIHKDRFLATVSHEMRTPLNAVMGYLGLLKNTDNLPAMAHNYVQGAQNSAAHLLTVINDLLDYSQIQQGKLILTPQNVNLHQVLKETHQVLAPKANEQNISYTLSIDPLLPRWVRIDPHRFTQVLLNLLGNALKFTERGSIETSVTFEPNLTNSKLGTLVLKVQDTGIGIAPEFLEKIFEPFVQLDSPVTVHQSDNALRGNGLGLSITQSLMHNLGGNIEIQSQVGVGSIFEIKLPIELSAPANISHKTPTAEQHLETIHLLLVDDHATNRLVASATIRQSLPNVHIDEARNGTEAIEKMKRTRYDLVLMDLIMPDYSGIEVVRIIRSECQAPLSDVPVIALTANLAKNAINECFAVGIHELLPKPFDREILIRTILQYATQTATETN